ncbi:MULTISPECIES: hypothetical protein [unclassified Mycobacterium]|uniref:hypothetical protein n=1 Tax=unclassified Mycobacterium TaxID=2642494 RepID=UPI0029C72A80|nr:MULTISPECIES: hypothetical protein [unclassified Mycobacterium]
MEASLRPWFTTGVALVGASAIAMAPINPITPSSPAADVRAAAAAVTAEFDLTALDIPYILTLPIVRQQIRNWAENWAVYLAGLGQAGIGLAQSLLSIPGVTVEVIQEVLALNFVGAFETLTTAVRDSVIAVGQPLLDSIIWRNQKAAAVQTALYAATPQAFIDVTNGFLQAGNIVTTSLIVGTQDLVAAILTLNLGNIIDAAVDGTRNFFVALGDGAGAIVAGIEAAQLGIATALATPPPPSPFVADVSAMRTLSTDTTFSLARGSSADTLEADGTPTPVVDEVPAQREEPTGVTDVGATAEADPPEAPAGPEVSPLSEVAHEAADPTEPPKKAATPDDKDDEADKDAAAKPDTGAAAKPASDDSAKPAPKADDE